MAKNGPMVSAITTMTMSLMRIADGQAGEMAQTCQTFLFLCQEHVGTEPNSVKVNKLLKKLLKFL